MITLTWAHLIFSADCLLGLRRNPVSCVLRTRRGNGCLRNCRVILNSFIESGVDVLPDFLECRLEVVTKVLSSLRKVLGEVPAFLDCVSGKVRKLREDDRFPFLASTLFDF